MTWRPTPNGQPACSMRRRRSWRPNGYACSRTRPCGSVNSPTCPPTFLRPGPARPASASPPPSGGGQANRGPTTVAGGRRGDGPRRRYGRPSGPLRRAGSPAERHCRTREVMPPPMITSRQRRPVPATITPMSRHRFRLQRPESVCVTHRHWWWHVEVDPCTASLPSPGRPQDGRGVRPAATRAPRPQRVSDPPQRCAGLMS